MTSSIAVRNLVFVLGDQVDRGGSAFDGFDPNANGEILVVVVIIGILATIATLSIGLLGENAIAAMGGLGEMLDGIARRIEARAADKMASAVAPAVKGSTTYSSSLPSRLLWKTSLPQASVPPGLQLEQLSLQS